MRVVRLTVISGCARERRLPRQQPMCAERRRRGEFERAAGALAGHQIPRVALDRVEPLSDLAGVGATRLGQHHAAARAAEQRHAELRPQPVDLAAYCAFVSASSSAALVKLWWRAAASKATSAEVAGNLRRMGLAPVQLCDSWKSVCRLLVFPSPVAALVSACGVDALFGGLKRAIRSANSE